MKLTPPFLLLTIKVALHPDAVSSKRILSLFDFAPVRSLQLESPTQVSNIHYHVRITFSILRFSR